MRNQGSINFFQNRIRIIFYVVFLRKTLYHAPPFRHIHTLLRTPHPYMGFLQYPECLFSTFWSIIKPILTKQQKRLT